MGTLVFASNSLFAFVPHAHESGVWQIPGDASAVRSGFTDMLDNFADPTPWQRQSPSNMLASVVGQGFSKFN